MRLKDTSAPAGAKNPIAGVLNGASTETALVTNANLRASQWLGSVAGCGFAGRSRSSVCQAARRDFYQLHGWS